MASKRIKFLKRVKILQHHIRLDLVANSLGKTFTFEVDLKSYRFPPEARIIVEARQLLESIRFDRGAVGAPLASEPLDISRLTGDRVTFNLWVVDPVNSRKLGSAEAIRRERVHHKNQRATSLLPVDASQSLGVVWRIEYADQDQAGHTDGPILMIDRDAAAGSAAEFIEGTAARAMILPAAITEILMNVLLVGDGHEYETDSKAWRDCWIRLASRLVGEPPPKRSGNLNHEYVQDAGRWIHTAAERLSKTGRLLETYVAEMQT